MQVPVPLRLSTKTALDLPQHLLRGQVVSQEQLARAEEVAKQTGQEVADVLVELRFVSDEDIARGVATVTGTQFVDLPGIRIPAAVIEIVPECIARENLIVPIASQDGTLTIAMTDPNESDAIAKFQFIFNTRIAVQVATASAINHAINQYYADKEDDVTYLVEGERGTGELPSQVFVCRQIASIDPVTEELVDLSQCDPWPSVDPGRILVDLLIADSVQLRAPHITFVAGVDCTVVRYIVDGEEQERDRLSLRLRDAITSRLLALANLDPADRTGVQSRTVRTLIKTEEYEFQIHFSHKPTATSILVVAPRAAGNEDPVPVQKWWAEARS